MSTLKIEKNIPIPKKKNRRIYPFKEMDIEDSFQIKIENNVKSIQKKQNIYVAIWRFCKTNPDKKFTTASIPNGVRVWRIK
ncbi:hypothetical protein [Flavobacterium sp. UMI-01]|uniref:hypothetical protein n=1 Tax=Flavobacterium sp. UMI-01 TaxID=1441053 RepID=UPI001C7D11C4|nr:hypothetical protein [Flavobacterium sp. UMI-01]